MTIATLIKAVCELLRTRTNASVSLGPPDGDSTGIFVWPWKMAENAALRDPPTHGAPPGAERRLNPPPVSVHFLIAVQPAFSEEGLSLLDKVRRTVFEHPVVTIDTVQAQLVTEPLSNEELASLFLTAGLPLAACVCVHATISSSSFTP